MLSLGERRSQSRALVTWSVRQLTKGYVWPVADTDGQIETRGTCDCNDPAQDKVGLSRTERMDDQLEGDLRPIGEEK